MVDVKLPVSVGAEDVVIVGNPLIHQSVVTEQVFELQSLGDVPAELQLIALLHKSLVVEAIGVRAQVIAIDVVPVCEHTRIRVDGSAETLVGQAAFGVYTVTRPLCFDGRTGSRIGVSALDEVMFREPVRENRCNQRTGRDLNPLDLTVVCHVLQTDSRACIES